MSPGLFALLLGALAIGVTEFAPMGLLPDIATGLQVSIPTAGLLVSAYAVGVMVAAPLTTLGLATRSRRTALVALMAVHVAGNALSGLSTGYGMLLAARLFTSLSHGAFFGIGATLAASLAPPGRQAAAVSTMFLGLTIANIGGVPAATYLGQALGWRLSFLGAAGLGVLAMAALWASLPDEGGRQRPSVAREIRALARLEVARGLLATVFLAGSMFTLYTYIAPTLHGLTGADGRFVTLMLVVIGLGFAAGNLVAGRLADGAPVRTLVGALGLLAAVSVAFPFLAATRPGAALALLVWGAATFAAAIPVQLRVMAAASEAPALASSINIGAFNLGNALGAAMGGLTLSLGLGYGWVAPVGGVLALVSLALVLAPATPSPAVRLGPDRA